MFRIDDPTAVGVLPTPAAPGTQGYFSPGDPGAAEEATIVTADFLNMVMLELINVLVAAGITPSKTTYDQLTTAINALIADAISGIAVPDASETVKGILELATQGESDAGADDLRAVTSLKAKTTLLGVARTFTAPQRATLVSRAFAASFTPNLGTDQDIEIGDLTADITVNNPTGGAVGQAGVMKFAQDGTGNRNWAWGTYYDFGVDGLPDPNFGADQVTYVQYYISALSAGGIRCTVLT
jgi:hypothetical protein